MLVVILFSCSDDGMPEPNEPPTVMTPETSEPTQTEKYTISTSAGTGGTITGNQTIESGQSVSITATAQEHYQLKEWTGDCGSFDKNNLKISFTASKNCQVSAVFEKIPYTITATSTSGGSIGEQTELNKVQGDTVTFTAIPEENFQFSLWKTNEDSDCPTLSEPTNPEVEFTVQGDCQLEAVFMKQPRTITTSSEEGGSITPTTVVEHGDEVVITATANEHYAFKGWSGSCGEFGADELTITITVEADCTIDAVFEKVSYTITATSSQGGSVFRDEQQVDEELSITYGQTAALTAIPDKGYQFSRWTTENCPTLEDATDVEAQFMVEGNCSLEAVFTKKSAPPIITINEKGTVTIEDGNEDLIGETITINVDDQEEEVEFVVVDDEMLRSKVKNGEDIENVVTTYVEDMSELFMGDDEIDHGISSWDVSNVTDMSKMFEGNSSFNQDISSWDVSNVTDMSRMFLGSTSFDQDISDWDVSNVTTMERMFALSDAPPSVSQIDPRNQNRGNRNAEVNNMNFNQDISKWNVGNVNDMTLMFAGAVKFDEEIGKWDVSNVSTFYGMFCGATSFNQNLGEWNISNATDLSYMFSAATEFNQDINDWDVSNARNMYAMFYNAESFNQPLNDWNVSNVIDMRWMFANAKAFNQDLGKNDDDWNVSNVTNMRSLFDGAVAFNGDISKWNVSKVTNMRSMFRGAVAFDGNIGEWKDKLSNVTDMGEMFSRASSFNQDISGWNTISVTIMYRMFYNAENFNQDLSKEKWSSWRDNVIANETDIREICDGSMANCPFGPPPPVGCDNIIEGTDPPLCIASNGVTIKLHNADQYFDTNGDLNNEGRALIGKTVEVDYGTDEKGKVEYIIVDRELLLRLIANGDLVENAVTSLITDMNNLLNSNSRRTFYQDIRSWDVSNVTNMQTMFSSSNFNQPLNDWDVSNVTNMSSMFRGAGSFNQPLNDWDVSNVTNMYEMFENANSFNQPLNDWDVSSVTNMKYMFYSADKFNQPLNKWNVGNVTDMSIMFATGSSSPTPAFNSTINGWDTSSVTTMERMFENSGFNQSLNKWDTSNVTNMDRIFANAKSFNGDIRSWDVSKITNMGYMFFNAQSFNQPLNDWDVSNVTNMYEMFENANSFNQPLNDWDVSSVTNMKYMFYSADKFNQPLNDWDTRKVKTMVGMFATGNSSPTPAFNQDLSGWKVPIVRDCSSFASNANPDWTRDKHPPLRCSY